MRSQGGHGLLSVPCPSARQGFRVQSSTALRIPYLIGYLSPSPLGGTSLIIPWFSSSRKLRDTTGHHMAENKWQSISLVQSITTTRNPGTRSKQMSLVRKTFLPVIDKAQAACKASGVFRFRCARSSVARSSTGTLSSTLRRSGRVKNRR